MGKRDRNTHQQLPSWASKKTKNHRSWICSFRASAQLQAHTLPSSHPGRALSPTPPPPPLFLPYKWLINSIFTPHGFVLCLQLSLVSLLCPCLSVSLSPSRPSSPLHQEESRTQIQICPVGLLDDPQMPALGSGTTMARSVGMGFPGPGAGMLKEGEAHREAVGRAGSKSQQTPSSTCPVNVTFLSRF